MLESFSGIFFVRYYATLRKKIWAMLADGYFEVI